MAETFELTGEEKEEGHCSKTAGAVIHRGKAAAPIIALQGLFMKMVCDR